MALAGLSWFIADVIYNSALNSGTFVVGGAEDFFWLLGFTLIATGAVMTTGTTTPATELRLEDSVPDRSALV